jgi:hypothetical protein
MKRDVDENDLPDWLDQGWLLDGDTAGADGGSTSTQNLTAEGGQGGKPKPGPKQ